MAEKRKDGADLELKAFQGVHAALKDLSPEARKKVLSSVSALLEIANPAMSVGYPAVAEAISTTATAMEPKTTSGRPLSIRELMQDKEPSTNMEKIALFAYYREKYEGVGRFSRGDLEKYFAKARENPPKNYDRDFTNTVLKGWIHEDSDESYITSKGLEAVESSFSDTSPKRDRGRRRERASLKASAKK